MIPRSSPLKRSTTPIRRVSRPRRVQNQDYAKVKAEYLSTHPFCQITIARLGLDESLVIVGNGWCEGCFIPRATTIHHRNKRDGDRLTDVRWFLSGCWRQHDWVEANKQLARSLGFLLPIQADKDGAWGSGNQGLHTPAFMASRIGLKS